MGYTNTIWSFVGVSNQTHGQVNSNVFIVGNML